MGLSVQVKGGQDWHQGVRVQGGGLSRGVCGRSMRIVFTARKHEWHNFIFTLAPHLRAMLLVASVLPPSATITISTRLSPLPRAQLQGPHEVRPQGYGMDMHAPERHEEANKDRDCRLSLTIKSAMHA